MHVQDAKLPVEPVVPKHAHTLIELGKSAIAELGQLDPKIYFYCEDEGRLLQDSENAEIILTQLAKDVLSGVRNLAGHLQSRVSSKEKNKTEEFDLLFDLTPESTPAPEDHVSDLNEFELDGAFAMLSDTPKPNTQERWSETEIELQSFAYGLTQQLYDFDSRFALSIETHGFKNALQLLNELGGTLTDAIFALLTVVYQSFLETVNLDDLLPGHRSTLSRALMLRKGITNLRYAVTHDNKEVQDHKQDESVRMDALNSMTKSLSSFNKGEVAMSMRPADRFELSKFQKQIERGQLASAHHECEGLAKYLDSLAVLNQRDVLIKHDIDECLAISGLLEAAVPLLDISPHGALAMYVESFQRAENLYGLREDLDFLIASWESLSEEETVIPTTVLPLGNELANIVRSIAR